MLSAFLVFSLLPVGLLAGHNFIVGGRDVEPPGKYPWQGYLERRGSFTCGCVLVGDNTVITAAHCVDDLEPSSYAVWLGAHDRESKVYGDPTPFNVSDITVHPNWTNVPNDGFPNDLAVLRLIDSIPAGNSWIRPIVVPEAGRGPPDWQEMDCTITGWGRLRGGGLLPNILQEAQIPVLLNDQCQEEWDDYVRRDAIQDYHVCVWDQVNQDEGACNGDSGGPLVCPSLDDGEMELVGVTSWGISDCGTDLPSVYTRVSYFRAWLDDVIPDPPLIFL